ncbi:Ppx/GppA family phosphatase [Hwanghaeella grinnelliae]|uniref:Ppx/GppA family phosphatase n=1 Tax=Hwanghaeella grinnelliae TaxID=2500179 RepID=A0A437QYK7_9PROT|nr:Ppx/GppA phosphatase family protein [Hwanghaeella grinnelliae]RVU39588.1 Ppx/GppA family phosphatase [Hwanghaeella grinnelliae]
MNTGTLGRPGPQENKTPDPKIRAKPRCFAAIDIGTSSCRMLIARAKGEGFQVIDSFAKNVRLGSGVSVTGMLSDAAMDRAVAALGVCMNKIRDQNAVHFRAVATEACRKARNIDQFLVRVQRELGLDIEVIGTDEEARLAIAGCLPLLNGQQPHGLVFDIGGGSTQLAWLGCRDGHAEVIGTHSIPNGVVSLTDRYGSRLADPALYETCVEEMSQKVRDFCHSHRIADYVGRGEVQMIGTSGTVTTLAGIEMGLERYIRSQVDGASLSFERIGTLTEFLRRLELPQLAAQPCIGEDRAELMLAGCAILEAICTCWPVGRLKVADRGLREGILLDLMRRHEGDQNGARRQ